MLLEMHQPFACCSANHRSGDAITFLDKVSVSLSLVDIEKRRVMQEDNLSVNERLKLLIKTLHNALADKNP
jgi:hypothetical protein